MTKTKTPRQINAERKKEGKPPLNFALFRKVIKKLEAAPMAYEQSDAIKNDGRAPCGTAACIGGWAYLLAGQSPEGVSQSTVLDRAGRMLGLSGGDENWDDGDAQVVFTGDPDTCWPSPFDTQWERVTTRRGQAQVALRYLKHIITTGKVLE